MLTDFFELFECGEEAFNGCLTDANGIQMEHGGRHALRTETMLLHEARVSLHLHQRIRRMRDGLMLRVLGESDDMRTPGCAMEQYACVRVEKVVDAP